MADKATIMREFVNSMTRSEGDKMASYCTDDCVWAGPGFTYKGKDGIKKYVKALSQSVKDARVTESGNGIVVDGDKAFFEHILSGTYQGKKFEYLAMCSYEFNGDKIKSVRTTSDRLGLAKQVAGGGFSGWMINMIVNRVEQPFKSAK
jgi:hypothetical protein